MSDGKDEYGPLPTADANAALQRRSFAALQQRLVEGFLVRDERHEDYGVDVSIEVLAGSHPTNCRAQAQVKGRTGLTPNADGSFSVSVAVTNLNYLLYGTCPVYLLYRPEANELLFTFAMDEVKRLGGDEWMKQGEVTLRISRLLDAEGETALRERILREARRGREVRDTVERLAPGDRVHIELSQDLAARTSVMTAERAAAILDRGGLGLVSRGFASQVLRWMSLLPAQVVRSSARLSLLAGFAEFSTEHYLAANAALRTAKVLAADLDEHDRAFLELLLISVDFAIGDGSADQFRAACDEWRARAPEYVAVQYDLARLWSELGQLAPSGVEKFRAQMDAVLRRTAELRDGPPALVQQARLLLAFFETQRQTLVLGEALGRASEPALNSRGSDPGPNAAVAWTAFQKARAELARVVAELRESQNPVLYCKALLARDIAEGFAIAQAYLVALQTGGPFPAVPASVLAGVRETQGAARALDQPETLLRSRLVESDLVDLSGDRDRAVAIASEVRDTARTLRYAEVARVAEKAIQDNRLEAVRRSYAQLEEDGPGFLFVDASDEDLERYAHEFVGDHGFPAEALPQFRDGLRCQRSVGQVQRTWCRHTQITDEHVRAANPDELFLYPPEWRVECRKLGIRSPAGNTDWAAALDGFRRSACDGCPERSPGGSDRRGSR